MRLIIVLLIFTWSFLSNSIADKKSNGKKIEELIDEGYSMISINHYESGYYHVVLEKKPVYRVIENQITEVSPTKILICKFNLKETICTHP
tara:strand:- start:136 stop:408 length:273 start_codon:yes stop_codon:yes gene_type:complete